MPWVSAAMLAGPGLGPSAAVAEPVTLPRSLVGTWASKRAHCDLDGVYALQSGGWIEGETWTCQLTGIERSRDQMTLKGPCLSEQTSERADRTLGLSLKAGRLTHIDGLRVLRCR